MQNNFNMRTGSFLIDEVYYRRNCMWLTVSGQKKNVSTQCGCASDCFYLEETESQPGSSQEVFDFEEWCSWTRQSSLCDRHCQRFRKT